MGNRLRKGVRCRAYSHRLQVGGIDEPSVRYFLSRLRAGEEDEKAQEAAAEMMRRSFAAYQAKASGQEDAFREKITTLQVALAQTADSTDTQAARVAAFTGLSSLPLEAAMARMDHDLNALPSTIVGWLDWMIEFFAEDTASYEALFGEDIGTVATVARGIKVRRASDTC